MNEVLNSKVEFATPWFELVSKQVAGQSAPYYALRMQDYVTVVAFTEKRELVLVRQYRAAVERHTLELPSGHVEKNETPEQAARRELAEECGFNAPDLELLGTLISDTGRNENRLWCYFAPGIVPVEKKFVPELGVEPILASPKRISELMRNGEFDHALNLAALMLAVTRHENLREIFF
jgi:ADP-ribose pyrophosphatase